MPIYVADRYDAVEALQFTGTNVEEMIVFIGYERLVGLDLLTPSKYLKVEYIRGYYRTIHAGDYFVKFSDGTFEIMDQRTFEKMFSLKPDLNDLRDDDDASSIYFTDDEINQLMSNAESARIPTSAFDISVDRHSISFCIILGEDFGPKEAHGITQKTFQRIIDPQGIFCFHFNAPNNLNGYITKGE